MNSKVLYRETQKPKSRLLWIFNLLFAGLFWYMFIQQIVFGVTVGNQPVTDGMMYVIFLIFGIIFPWVSLFLLKLTIEVREDGIYVRYTPFHIRYREFKFEDIQHYEMMNYEALKDFGGWGIRINTKGETGYIVGGNDGLRLKMKFETFVISTQNRDELEAVINSLNGPGKL